jgi:hypothetical protein
MSFEMAVPARSASPVADAALVGGEAMQQASPSASPAVAEAGAADERPVQKNTSRCLTCKKKVNLLSSLIELLLQFGTLVYGACI